MKGMTAFSRISDVSDYLIEESLELFESEAPAPALKPQSAFSRLTNSGWFVAAVCALVSVLVMGGIIWAGFNPPMGRPDDPVTDTQTENTETTIEPVFTTTEPEETTTAPEETTTSPEETVETTEPEETELDESSSTEPEEPDRTPLVSKSYIEGVWPNAARLIGGWYEIEIPLGELYRDFCTKRLFLEQYDADYRTGAEYYEAVVVVEDPEIVEVVSVDNYALCSSSSRGGVVLRGLKEGTTTVTLKLVYKATGGYEAHEIPVTVVQSTGTDTEDETASGGVDPSEVWEVFFTHTNTNRVYTVREGETFDGFSVEFRCTWCRGVFNHPTNCPHYGEHFRYEDYSFDLSASNEGVVELLSLNKYAIMNSCQIGGITVVGLREGSTTLALTMTHIPSGKSKTVEATVNVIVDDSPIMPDDHSDEAWPGVVYPAFALYSGPITAGKTVQVTFSVYDGEIAYNRQDYIFEVTAYDPTVIEIVSDGYKSYVKDEIVYHVAVKGLKAGETWVQMKMIHKATGAASYTYVALSVKE